ncbi:hypothetical protein OAM23_03175 [Luminiphilus sp.]|nr:hypothetical protein [Luminiphilus sp.]
MTRRCINPALYALALRAKALPIKALRIKARHTHAPHIKVLQTKHFSPKPYGKPMGLLEKRSF